MFARVVDWDRDFIDGELKSLLEEDGDGEKKNAVQCFSSYDHGLLGSRMIAFPSNAVWYLYVVIYLCNFEDEFNNCFYKSSTFVRVRKITKLIIIQNVYNINTPT